MKIAFTAVGILCFTLAGISDAVAQNISRARALAIAREDSITPLRKIERIEYTQMSDGTPCWKVSEKINLRKCYRNAHSGMNRFHADVLYISAANTRVLAREQELRGSVHINPSF